MPAGAEKLSISLPSTLAKAVRKRVGERGVSAFVARALQHELEREQLGAYLEELDAQLGIPEPKALARVRRAWPKR